MLHTPYTYLIGWSDLNTYYYGVRYAVGCHPSDLFVTYFTSSDRVFELQEKHGSPDIIQVRRTFETQKSAITWETKVLRRINVHVDKQWLNQNVAGAILHTEDVRRRMSEAKKGREAHNKGVPCSEEQKAKISATRKKKGLGKKSAKYLKPHFGNDNPMRNPEVVAAYKKRITGRKRAYREDGSWFWSYSDKNTASEDAVG